MRLPNGSLSTLTSKHRSMSPTPLPNYLRTCRKRAGLSQNEVAFLFGSKAGAKVCRYERYRQSPNLKTLLAYEMLFRTPVQKLFRGLHQEVERDLLKRIRILLRKLAKAGRNRVAARKIEFLNALSKLSPAPNPMSDNHGF